MINDVLSKNIRTIRTMDQVLDMMNEAIVSKGYPTEVDDGKDCFVSIDEIDFMICEISFVRECLKHLETKLKDEA